MFRNNKRTAQPTAAPEAWLWRRWQFQAL